jgi:hypothetical protein
VRVRRKRSKVWAKSTAPSKREAQRLADQFMEKVNARNNEPGLYPSDDETLASRIAKCRGRNRAIASLVTPTGTEMSKSLRIERRFARSFIDFNWDCIVILSGLEFPGLE